MTLLRDEKNFLIKPKTDKRSACIWKTSLHYSKQCKNRIWHTVAKSILAENVFKLMLQDSHKGKKNKTTIIEAIIGLFLIRKTEPGSLAYLGATKV